MSSSLYRFGMWTKVQFVAARFHAITVSQLDASYNSVAAAAAPRWGRSAAAGPGRGRAQCVCGLYACVVSEQRRVASPRCRDSERTKVRFLGWRGRCVVATVRIVVAHPSQKHQPSQPSRNTLPNYDWVCTYVCIFFQ